MGKERRQFGRVPEAFDIKCRTAGALAEVARSVMTTDISAGGMGFRTDWAYEPSSTLELHVTLPTFRTPLVVRGRIVRESRGPAGLVEYAVEFIDVTPDQQVGIDEMVAFLGRRPSP